MTPRHQMLNAIPAVAPDRLQLAVPRIGVPMTDTLIANAWRAAHRRMDRILKLFFIIGVFGTFIGVIYHDAWVTIVWLVAAFSAGIIVMPERESLFTVNMTEDDELTNEKGLIEAYVFARKFVEASNLLAATMLAVGFVIGNPWWSNLLVALSTWFVVLFGLPLLCAARNNRACDADGDAGGGLYRERRRSRDADRVRSLSGWSIREILRSSNRLCVAANLAGRGFRSALRASPCEQNEKCGSLGRPAPSTDSQATPLAYLEKLNTEQRRAVEHGVGGEAGASAAPLLVIAGAGSGKTNTLAHRVAHLIVNGVDPRRILLMTFSRRAASEMTPARRAHLRARCWAPRPAS